MTDEKFVTKLLELVWDRAVTGHEENAILFAVSEWLKGKGYIVGKEIKDIDQLILENLDELGLELKKDPQNE